MMMGENTETSKPKLDDTERRAETSEVDTEIKSRIDSVKMYINDSITERGLIPEIGERGKDEGFNSEMLGYALRIAVNTGDRDLFDRLKRGADSLKTDNGLFQARLDREETPDTSQGITWADANQDIALSYIEAGKKWGSQDLVDEGVRIANAFIEKQVVESGGHLIPLQNTIEEDDRVLGGEIRRTNLSMYNLRLFEMMQDVSPDDDRWSQLVESATHLIGESMNKFVLPPNVMNVVDGKMLSDGEVKEEVERNSELARTIPEATKRKVTQLKSDRIRPEWGFDSMRIPFRLNDVSSKETRKLAGQIHKRLQEHGGIKTKYYADNGGAHPDGISVAVATSPFLKTIQVEANDKQKALDELDKAMSETDDQVLYWQLWRGLGLSQLLEK